MLGSSSMCKAVCVSMCALMTACATVDNRHKIHISVAEQRMLVTDEGRPVVAYPVSTSKFGEGSEEGSLATPLGDHRVAKKIGGGLPSGAVLKSRRFTGEILRGDEAGRDAVVTRILWLDGTDRSNRSSFSRHIYIHGTAEEGNIGKRASYGCVRMRSADVIELYELVGVGAKVHISSGALGGT